MKHQLKMDSIAEGLGAERVGKVRTSGGYLGAAQLAAEVARHFRVPPGGGRATNPEWTERRLIPLSQRTLKRLEEMASTLHVAPLQVAALLLEQALSGGREEAILEVREPAPEYDPDSR